MARVQALGAGWEPFFRAVTVFGSSLLVLVGAAALAWNTPGRRGRWLLLVLLVSIWLNHILKVVIAHERPAGPEIVQYATADSYSLPSGHAQAAATFWLALAAGWRVPVWAALPPVALVALSRVYLGVHFPGDVLTGIAVGGALVWWYARQPDDLARLSVVADGVNNDNGRRRGAIHRARPAARAAGSPRGRDSSRPYGLGSTPLVSATRRVALPLALAVVVLTSPLLAGGDDVPRSAGMLAGALVALALAPRAAASQLPRRVGVITTLAGLLVFLALLGLAAATDVRTLPSVALYALAGAWLMIAMRVVRVRGVSGGCQPPPRGHPAAVDQGSR